MVVSVPHSSYQFLSHEAHWFDFCGPNLASASLWCTEILSVSKPFIHSLIYKYLLNAFNVPTTEVT